MIINLLNAISHLVMLLLGVYLCVNKTVNDKEYLAGICISAFGLFYFVNDII